MIPYSVRDRKINVNEISGIDLLNALDNELLMKNSSNQIEGGHVTTVSTSILGTDTNYLNVYFSDDTTPITTIGSETDSTNYKMHLYPKSLIANASQNAMSIVNNPANNEVRVGINITSPQESLEVDGSIQIDSANVARLKFQKSGGSPHALGEIDGEEDSDGGDLQFYTKLDGASSVTEKLRINNVGAIGIGGANFGTQGQVLTSNGSGSAVSWENPGVRIITSVKKTVSQSFTSGSTSIKITGWDAPHVDIGTTGWSNANSRYTIQRTATYRIDFKAIITNTSNDNSALRYLNMGIYIYNSGGGAPVFQDLDTTTLVNVDSGFGFAERGSGDYTIIRTLTATQYLEFQLTALQATGNYSVESAVFNIEELV